VNHFVAKILAAASLSLEERNIDPNKVMCEGCEESEACDFCKNCGKSFCDHCKDAHLQQKATARHHFISLDEAMKPGGEGFGSRIALCEVHAQQEINTYCRTDKQAICPECAADFHQEHKVEKLSNVVNTFKEEISQLVDKV